jgi:SAM-dependent methyltransferase
LQLYCALARLCFVNDYVFDCTVDESWRASALRQQLVTALQAGAEVPALWPTAVAAYVPLHVLPGQDLLLSRSWPAPIAHLLEQQIGAPQRSWSFALPSPADPDRKRRVAAGHPAIRGKSVSALDKASAGAGTGVVRPIPAPLVPAGLLPSAGQAGRRRPVDCGLRHGRHAVEIAQRLTGARLLAVDLSPMSLGYAKRQSLALDVDNIEFAQADILELASLGRSFDVIEAVGSLQTLADPRAGWKVLSSLLRPGGFIFFGLYSESARRNIVAARDFIARQNYSGRAEDIRRCRQELMDFPNGTALKNVTYTTEFYNTSECRDLLFHVQEHRTTLPEIKADLAAHNLEFIGFEIDSSARRQYAARFPADRAMADLDRWHELETDHP